MTNPALSLPETALAASALAFVEATHPPLVRNHSLRTFLYARALAPTADYDPELVFLICALHDVGLTDAGAGSQRFEVEGADRAATFLEANGASDAQIDVVWDGIALHTTPSLLASPVFARRRPAEILIAQAGIRIDVLGGPEDLPPGYADRVHAVYPRLGGAPALTELILAGTEDDARKAPPWTLPGELRHQRRPEARYLSWDVALAHGRWGDRA